MSTPPTVTVTLDQHSYAPGASMTATVTCTAGTADQVTSYGAQAATGPGGVPGVLAVTFTTQTADPPMVEVTDSAGRTWGGAGGGADGITTWTSAAPGTPGPLTVMAVATGPASGLSATATAETAVRSLPAVGCNKGAWAAVSAVAGPLTAFRGYDSPKTGVPSSWPGASAGPIPPGVLPIVSLNLPVGTVLDGTLDAALTSWAAQVPAGALVTVGAEDERGALPWLPVQIRALHARCYQLIKRASPDCLYGQIVTTYTATPASAHYPLATSSDPRWVQADLDWYGLDAYQTSPTDTPAANLGAAIAQMRLAGAAGPWVVTETNTHYGDRAGWFTACWEYAREIGALAVCSFWGDAPYAWDAGDTATIRALAQMAAAVRA